MIIDVASYDGIKSFDNRDKILHLNPKTVNQHSNTHSINHGLALFRYKIIKKHDLPSVNDHKRWNACKYTIKVNNERQ